MRFQDKILLTRRLSIVTSGLEFCTIECISSYWKRTLFIQMKPS